MQYYTIRPSFKKYTKMMLHDWQSVSKKDTIIIPPFCVSNQTPKWYCSGPSFYEIPKWWPNDTERKMPKIPLKLSKNRLERYHKVGYKRYGKDTKNIHQISSRVRLLKGFFPSQPLLLVTLPTRWTSLLLSPEVYYEVRCVAVGF